MAFDVTQLTHRFHTADFDGLDFVFDQYLFQGRFLTHLVVPDLNLDAAILCAPGSGIVRCGRLCITLPRVGDAFGGKRKRCLHVLGNLACALTRQTHVIAVDLNEPWRQSLVIGVANQVQAQVHAVAHTLENLAE